MLTTSDLKTFFDNIPVDEEVVFSVIHPDDEKDIERSHTNKVPVILHHPTIATKAISAGLSSIHGEDVDLKKPMKPTIFLIGK